MVKQILSQIDLNIFLAGEASTRAVIQLATVQYQPFATCQQPFVLIEKPLHRQVQAAVGNHFTATVIQKISSQQYLGLAGNLASLIEQSLAVQGHAFISGDQAAVAVVQRGGFECQCTFADQLTTLLIQDTNRDLQTALGTDPPGAVFDLVGIEGQKTLAAQFAAGVIQTVQLNTGTCLAADNTFLAVINAATPQGQCSISDHQACVIDQGIAVQRQACFAGDQSCLGVVQLTSRDLLSPLTDQIAFVAVVEQTGDGCGQADLAGQRTLATVIQAGGLNCQPVNSRKNAETIIDCAAGRHVKVAAQQRA